MVLLLGTVRKEIIVTEKNEKLSNFTSGESKFSPDE